MYHNLRVTLVEFNILLWLFYFFNYIFYLTLNPNENSPFHTRRSIRLKSNPRAKK